ncbi:exonuclease domain-containing protein [Pseudoalteromonas tunicata]|uniref:exonuclease domain-containing protein n=1 Tax=Pseudoalteromonas tunicata TaxID=314281 RepID=UPI003515918F
MYKIVFIDTETTGLKPFKGDRAIDIACIEYQNGKKTGRQFNTRLNPKGKSSDKRALKIHGISINLLFSNHCLKMSLQTSSK